MDGADEVSQLADRLREGSRIADTEAESDGGDSEAGGTGVVMSQLRHFVIQEYMPRPMLFDMTQTPGDTGFEPMTGNKVHPQPPIRES